MDKYLMFQLEKLRAESAKEIESDAVCELCGRHKKDPVLMPVNKLNVTRAVSMFDMIHVELSHHVQEKNGSLILCDKCHYCYHNFPVLSEEALEECQTDTLFWKQEEIEDGTGLE